MRMDNFLHFARTMHLLAISDFLKESNDLYAS